MRHNKYKSMQLVSNKKEVFDYDDKEKNFMTHHGAIQSVYINIVCSSCTGKNTYPERVG